MVLDPLQTLAAAACVVGLGQLLRKQVRWIDRYNLPAPVMGGLLVAVVLAVLRQAAGWTVEFGRAFEQPLMIAFFASVGYSASFRLLKRGGRAVVMFLVLAVVGLGMQIAVGVAAARAMGEPALLGVLTGAVALTGGPGTAMAFAPAFEQAGVADAGVIGLTAAMGGILLGGLLGTPLATWMIERRRLAGGCVAAGVDGAGTAEEAGASLPARPGRELPLHVLALAVIMGLGTTLGGWLTAMGVTLPVYIGAMLVAAAVRALEDVRPVFGLRAAWIDELGAAALTLFLAMAMMSLRLDALRHAALPIVVFLAVQAVVVVWTAAGPGFRLAGGGYEGAVTSAGYVGFMMGTTANAMANMAALTRRYGAAPRAFLVVPIVGSCFIDFFNATLVTLCLNLLR